MKKILILILSISFFSLYAQVEYSIPETPGKIEFANVIVNLDAETQAKVHSYVVSLLTPQNAYLESKLQLMQWYFPFIEDILEKENVPDDLKYLAVQESDLKPDALSSSAAVGFWQFKEATGREFGLRIDNEIDERRYIFASTAAAANYFKKNNIIFKNWLSCIYAYNQGPTGASKSIPDSWSYAGEVTFTNETPDYLLKALAHRIAYEHRLNRLKKPSKKLVVYPTKSKSLAEIAVELTVDLSELRKYNAWLYAAAIPPTKEYNILIPISSDREQEIVEKINKRRDLVKTDKGYPLLTRITMVTTSDEDPIFYTINSKKGILAQPGDEVFQLAAKADITVPYFLKFNDLTDKDMISTGSVYYIQPKGKKGPIEFHTAAKNQTFWDVSQIYGIRLKLLLKYNRLKKPETLQPGRVVWLQRKRPSNTPVEIIQEILKDEEPELMQVQTTYEAERELKLDETPVVRKPDVVEKKPEPARAAPEAKRPADTEPTTKPIVITRIDSKPTESKTPVVENKTANTKKPEIATAQTHLVRQGETFFSISKRYGLTLNELLSLNDMTRNEVLKYGQELIVSKGNTPSSITQKPEPTLPKAEKPAVVQKETPGRSESFHVVQRGETLFSISKKYETTIANIQKMNGLIGTNISVGQRLSITDKGSNGSSGGSTSHVVEKGETLFSISTKYDVSVSEIKSWNNLRDNTISIGQNLVIRK